MESVTRPCKAMKRLIEESEKASNCRNQTQARHPGLCSQCSATELQQPDNHQPYQLRTAHMPQSYSRQPSILNLIPVVTANFPLFASYLYF